MAALCHDIGHLPFSHAAEKQILPTGVSHENLTRMLIESEEMKAIWANMTPPLNCEHVVKLAVGPTRANDLQFTILEAVLSEIIVGDAFGVDRIDYLLRELYHAGVAYGRFDHHRLIDTLRILPTSPLGEEEQQREPGLGIEEGGIHSAEALALARYFMYSQVYFHAVRRAYDIHLTDFLEEWLPDGRYPRTIDGHLELTDNEVWAGILRASRREAERGHVHARRITGREHFRVVYARNPDDVKANPAAAESIYEAVRKQFGDDKVRYDPRARGSSGLEFPVFMNDKRIASSVSLSETLRNIPEANFEYVMVSKEIEADTVSWLKKNRQDIISAVKGEEGA